MNINHTKEKLLRKLDGVYQKLVISSEMSETKAFTKMMETVSGDVHRQRMTKFIQTYQDDVLCIDYESVVPHYGEAQIFDILLSDLLDCDGEYTLYLNVPRRKITEVKETFNKVFLHMKGWVENISGSYLDDGYVVDVRDNRSDSAGSYIKVYPNGQVRLVTDYDYRIDKTEFFLVDVLSEKLNSEIKKKVTELVEGKRSSSGKEGDLSEPFIITYGLEWLGYNQSLQIDREVCFAEKAPLSALGKLLEIPIIKEKFIR